MVMKSEVNNAFEALEGLYQENRMKVLEFENAELQRKNAELMERCKTLASRVPAWPKGYRPTRKALDEKKRYDRRTN
jgi:hypothetical protein|tara:strand:+ start:381 stop:611 length:231 start_codon:yes stop_codon:yes gene_type:complete